MATKDLPDDPTPPEMYAPTIEAMRKDRKFLASRHFIIGCGCVTLDPAPRRRVLLVLNHKHDIYQIPKGRKNIGEDMAAAAVRETYEETGYRPTLLPARVPTRATPAHTAADGPDVTETVVCCEPVASVVHPDPYSGAMKMVFFFLATGDSEAEQVQGTQDESWEELEAVWVPADTAAATLTFKEDGNVVECALEVARANGVDI